MTWTLDAHALVNSDDQFNDLITWLNSIGTLTSLLT